MRYFTLSLALVVCASLCSPAPAYAQRGRFRSGRPSSKQVVRQPAKAPASKPVSVSPTSPPVQAPTPDDLADAGAPPKPFEPAMEVDSDEIVRRGDMVEEVGNGHRAEQMDIDIALAVPADDSGKWWICVITKENCKYCDRLKHDFINNKTLKAWVNVEDEDASWAHYQVYRWEDATQRARWAKLKGTPAEIRGFPTIIVQPPLSGDFGPNETIVFKQTGYGGDAEKLSKGMSDKIKQYVAAMNKRRGGVPLIERGGPRTSEASPLGPAEDEEDETIKLPPYEAKDDPNIPLSTDEGAAKKPGGVKQSPAKSIRNKVIGG